MSHGPFGLALAKYVRPQRWQTSLKSFSLIWIGAPEKSCPPAIQQESGHRRFRQTRLNPSQPKLAAKAIAINRTPRGTVMGDNNARITASLFRGIFPQRV